VLVLGHPGHELAIFGFLQQYPPLGIVVITDGGDRKRVLESQEGLRRLGLLERARYLDFPESSFYQALLDRDAGRLEAAARAVREAVLPLAPTQVLCDAVEFYNPLHDITLPLVRVAFRGCEIEVFEIPLIYEVAGRDDQYEVQRLPESLAARRITFRLNDAQLAKKVAARNEVYQSLHHQAGPELLLVSEASMAREDVAVAPESVPSPGADGRGLRYERRARLLQAQGKVERVISHAGHFRPMLEALGVKQDATLAP
jgi:hypothetical protein